MSAGRRLAARKIKASKDVVFAAGNVELLDKVMVQWEGASRKFGAAEKGRNSPTTPTTQGHAFHAVV